MNVSAYPKVAAALKYQRAKLNDPLMTEYWAAVAVAESYSDEALKRFGGFNFEDRSAENGKRLLSRLEEFMKKRTKRAMKHDPHADARSSIQATLGAFGVKTSMLNGVADCWRAAMLLWPGKVFAEEAKRDWFTLRFQIGRLSKKERSRIARTNIDALPAEWRAAR